MSLVERAAERLEELRRSGERMADDSVTTTTNNHAQRKVSTAERVAQEIARRTGPPAEPAHDAALARAGAADRLALDGGLDAGRRREPILPGATLQSTSGEHAARTRIHSVDFARLAAHGYLTPDASGSRLANELRVIKRPLINNALGKSAAALKNANRILITSAVPGEGKSFLSTNLAISIAMERDSTVLLVEADPIRPALSRVLGLPLGRGLMNLLHENIKVEDVLVRLNIGRLSFIPSGTQHEHATELLASAAMEQLIDQLATRYPDRVLIFDGPPLLAAPEARVLARYMGQIVLVVEAGKTTHNTARQALASIESCPVVLPVLNKASAREERMYYYAG